MGGKREGGLLDSKRLPHQVTTAQVLLQESCIKEFIKYLKKEQKNNDIIYS